MDVDLIDYCVIGMPLADFLGAFLPQTTRSTTRNAQACCEARPDCDNTGKRMMCGTKRARAANDLHMKPIVYGRYVEVDYGGLLRVDTNPSKIQAIKLLPDIFVDLIDCGQRLEHTDTPVTEVLAFTKEAHIVSDRDFSIVVFFNEDYFRLIRADRDGIIVTEKTNWAVCETSHTPSDIPKNLDDLVCRMKGLAMAQQGFDSTICNLLPEEMENRERAIQALKGYTRRAAAKPTDELVVCKIGVPCAGAQDNLRWFYTCGPESDPDGLRQRATRGYVAWDPVTDSVVFVKDCWRSVGGDLLPEAAVIAQLNAEKVKFAPKLICGGDIPAHRTITHEYVHAPWNKGRRKTHEPRVHHRFAINLGQPLWKFRSSKHLLQILHDAFTCHRQAVGRCRKLHRDISAWNILWDEATGRGILSDWDQCAEMPPLSASELDPNINMMAQLPPPAGRSLGRTGTWAFMSTLSLNHANKLYDVQDDLESIFWVAVLMIVLYFPVEPEAALHVVDRVFNQYQCSPDGVLYGGDGKRTFVSIMTTSADNSASTVNSAPQAPESYHRFHLAFTETVSAPLSEWLGMYRRMVRQWIAYQDGLRGWRGRQRRRELACRLRQAEGEGDGSDGEGGEGDDDSDEDDANGDDCNEDDDEDNEGEDSVDDVDDDPKPQAPPLRDYRKLGREWRSIWKKKRAFEKNDRLSDELHELGPEAIIAKYKELVEMKLQEEQTARWDHSFRLASRGQRGDQHLSMNAGREQDDTMPIVSPIDDAATDMHEGDAERVTKRQRISEGMD